MSYSRFISSSWYVYPSAGKFIEVMRTGFEEWRWYPAETLEGFLEQVESQMEHDEFWQKDIASLRSILESNIEDIRSWFAKWESEKETES